jgi:hypothetical protein
MIRKYQNHSAKVKSWIEAVTPGLSSSELIDLFELAITRLWSCSCNTIGEVTLLAIADRALVTCIEIHQVSLPLRIDSTGILWEEFRQSDGNLKRNEIIQAFTYFITEFIAITSSITGEYLSSQLHKELAAVVMKNKNPRGNYE